MEIIVAFFKFVYVYCTDFIINISNIIKISYYETNLIIFCFIYPFLCVLLPIVYYTLKIKNKKYD